VTAQSEIFWTIPAASLLSQTQSRLEGLTESEAAERLLRFGPNTVTEIKTGRFLTRIAKRISNPLVAILLVAAAISGLTSDFASFAIILVVLSFSIILDVVQEHRADLAAEALRRSVAINADVLRNGKLISLPVNKLVPGDVLELRAGDLIPADGIVLKSRMVHVNEALLTGEPFPVEKRPGRCETETPAEAFNALFAGTSVVSGEATMLIVVTGANTQFGRIAAALDSNQSPSALEHGVNRLGVLILRLTSFLVLFVLLVHLALGRPFLETFLFAVALAVGLTPELLPMIMTVTLSRGAVQMARKRVIVKRLAAIHDLGAMNVLCTDKTGTLTEAQVTLTGYPGCDGIDNDRVLLLAGINSRLGSGIRSPLDSAILQRCPSKDIEKWTKVDELPFDFERRRVSILAEANNVRLLIMKGAPESIVARVGWVEHSDGTQTPFDADVRARLDRWHDDQAKKGQRLLAVAWKPIPGGYNTIEEADENDLVLAGYCAFVDPPKAGADAAVATLVNLGVTIKVVSGDHDIVVRQLAETLKIPSAGLLSGSQLDSLTDTELAARVEQVSLFARVTPDQKLRIIRALQARGYTTGFLGDGVNDAPAIRAAEVGLSVEGATDVAREAADIILLARDLKVVADGVTEGRRTLANILKYVRMGTSSNFGNMLSMALASLVLPFLPLLPVQILLNNLLYDLSEIGIPFDRVDQNDVARPRAWDMSEILRFTLIMGTVSSLFDFVTFAILLKIYNAGEELFRTAWFLESLLTQILVIFVIRTVHLPWASRPHPTLVATSFGALIVALIISLSSLGYPFGFTVLPTHIVLAIAIIVFAYLMAAQIAKRFTRSLKYTV